MSLIFTLPPGWLEELFHALEELRTAVFASLSIDAAVVPGQPIPISLSFFSENSSLDFGTGCRIAIFLDQDKIFQMPNDETFLPYTPSSLWKVDIGTIQALIDPPPPYSPLGENLYAFGQHTLRLEITTNGRDRGPYTDNEILTVVPESVSQSWWQWQGDLLQGVAWKASYTLAGTCVNKSQFVRMQFTVELDETDGNGNTKSYGDFSVEVEKQQSSPLTFPPITQAWPWLIQGLWAPEDQTGKEFFYTANITLQDSYGNQYPPVNSSTLEVVVNVSDTKLGEAQAAFSSNASAIALGIASAFFWWLAPAAAAATIAAAVLGEEALDPPEPSPYYLEQVEPVPFVWSEELSKSDKLIEFRAYFDVLGELLGDLIALGEIEARLLGAQASRSKQGIELQVVSYRQIVQQMEGKARTLAELAESAMQSTELRQEFSSQEIKAFIARNKPASSVQITRHLEKVGFDQTTLETVKEVIASPKLRELMLSLEGFTRLFPMTSLRMIQLIRIIQSASEKTLRRYESH
jgi:hypothetical protein